MRASQLVHLSIVSRLTERNVAPAIPSISARARSNAPLSTALFRD